MANDNSAVYWQSVNCNSQYQWQLGDDYQKEKTLDLKAPFISFIPFSNSDCLVVSERESHEGFKVRRMSLGNSSKKEEKAKRIYAKGQNILNAKMATSNSDRLVSSLDNKVIVWDLKNKEKPIYLSFNNDDQIVSFDLNKENQLVVLTKKTITLWNIAAKQSYFINIEKPDNAVLFGAYLKQKNELYIVRQKTVEIAKVKFTENNPVYEQDKVVIHTNQMDVKLNSNFQKIPDTEEESEQIKKFKIAHHIPLQEIDVPTAMCIQPYYFAEGSFCEESRVLVGTKQGQLHIFTPSKGFHGQVQLSQNDPIKHLTANAKQFFIAQRDTLSIIDSNTLETNKISAHSSFASITYLQASEDRLIAVYAGEMFQSYVPRKDQDS